MANLRDFLIDPEISASILVHAYASRWASILENGTMVCIDSIRFLGIRAFLHDEFRQRLIGAMIVRCFLPSLRVGPTSIEELSEIECVQFDVKRLGHC